MGSDDTTETRCGVTNQTCRDKRSPLGRARVEA